MKLEGAARQTAKLALRSASERHKRINYDLSRVVETARGEHKLVDGEFQRDLRTLAGYLGMDVPETAVLRLAPDLRHLVVDITRAEHAEHETAVDAAEEEALSPVIPFPAMPG